MGDDRRNWSPSRRGGEVYKRDIDTATRRRLAGEGKALPNLSYPIENAEDLGNAATLARSGHGNVAAARKLLSRAGRRNWASRTR